MSMMSSSSSVTWAVTTNNIPLGTTVVSTGSQGSQNKDVNTILDLEDELAGAQEQIEELEAKLYDARMIIARMYMGNVPDDDELAEHLEAVAEEFE